ncbi:MAG: hypothetical protein U9O56_05205 [Campylobacterota bacterium]|nr:hypothetical protein [Campylobacterota bacterium]
MDKFITYSQSSKDALRIMQMSSNLPVNILVNGQSGIGKKQLIKTVFPNIPSYNIDEFENLLAQNEINLKEYQAIILYGINKIKNKKIVFEKLENIRIIATSFLNYEDKESKFAIKIEIEPLENRKEDLDYLIQTYTNEAKKIYNISVTPKDVKINLSGNGRTLKQSIYKSILLRSISKNDLKDILCDFIKDELSKNKKSYKELLEFFEVPLLKAAKSVYKSQLQISKNLKINRITVRKKLTKYFGE